ncbi:MAG: CHAT domain-containing protein [Anaerolineales bacterium]|nr:CHAT domain-containing protein [Anaerolineales bacterium]
MPIATDSRDKIDPQFVLLPATATAQDARNAVGDEQWTYVIVELAGGDYALFYLAHLVDALQKMGGITPTLLAQPLQDVPNLLAAFKTIPIDIATTELGRGYKQLSKTPLKTAVAIENGAVVGVLATPAAESRSDVPNVDITAIPVTREAMEMAEPTETETAAKAIEPRFMNVELFDAEMSRLAPETTPLEKEKPYYLTFFVDSVLSAAHIGGSDTEIGAHWFGGDDEIALTIQLKSDDFAFDYETKNLYVPRTGRSDKERFQITPKHDGACQITAVVLKGNAFVQVITLKFHVGPLFTAETLGHNLDSAPKIAPRDLHLTFLPEGDNGFRVILSGPVAATAVLPINRRFLAHLVAQARKTLLDIVHFEAGDVRLYQTRMEIPTAVNDRTLPMLANAGYDLFDQIFYGPGHDLAARAIGDALRKMAREQDLHIQIFSQNFMLPWGIMYVGDDPDTPQPEMFLGLRHIIEHIPLQPNMQVFDHEIDISDGLHVGLNVNTDIDQQMGQPIIQRQLDSWQTITQANSHVRVEVRQDHLSVLEALNAGDAPDDVMYFYCHAESFDLNEPDTGTPGQSRLIFNNHQALTLRKLERNKTLLAGQPLVFINACESAELSPEFYDGFVPYFVNKGARGVIGTECETPALFAEAFAKRFFERFLKGEASLGEIFLALRREFYFEQNNVMGLVYALYVDGDTKLSATAVG